MALPKGWKIDESFEQHEGVHKAYRSDRLHEIISVEETEDGDYLIVSYRVDTMMGHVGYGATLESFRTRKAAIRKARALLRENPVDSNDSNGNGLGFMGY